VEASGGSTLSGAQSRRPAVHFLSG